MESAIIQTILSMDWAIIHTIVAIII
jgi:hypothetical protein